jgi:excinuclease ABC subunit A
MVAMKVLKLKPMLTLTDTILHLKELQLFITKQAEENPSPAMQRWVNGFTNKIACDSCNGTRLKKQALYFKVDNKNIAELSTLDVAALHEWV